MDVKLIAKMIEINAMIPMAVVAVHLNVPAEGAGALVRERRRMIDETIAMTIKTIGVQHVMVQATLEIRDSHPEMETIGRRRGRLPILTNTVHQSAVGGAAVEEMNIVLPDLVVELIVVMEIVVTEIAITEDLLPPEMATIVHLEAMIHAKRMDCLVVVVVEELEFTALPPLVEMDLAMKGRAVVMITMETDVQRRMLLRHPARMKRHEFEDWKSPKRPYLRIATSLPTCWPRMKVPTNQTAEMNSKGRCKEIDLNDYNNNNNATQLEIPTQFLTLFL